MTKKKPVKKSSPKTKRTRIGKNTDFRLGLDRAGLIEAAILHGKTEKQAKQASTISLENFLVKETTGLSWKRAVIPTLTERDLRDIKRMEGIEGSLGVLKIVTYNLKRANDALDEKNFLRMQVAVAFKRHSNIPLTSELLDKLMDNLPHAEYQDNVSGAHDSKIEFIVMFDDIIEEMELEKFR